MDLLITDVLMPRMSGRQLAEELRTRQPDRKVLDSAVVPESHR